MITEKFGIWWKLAMEWFKEEFSTLAKEETSNAILSAVSDSDSKQAFDSMKRIQPYLYGIEYQSLNYEEARAHMLAASVLPSACTTIRRGAEVGRNFDWSISHQVEFLVRTKEHNGRYATIGFCGALPTLTKDVVESREYREEYRYLPFYMQDGMNSEGLVATIHQLPDNATRSQSAEGNSPLVDERERISAVMLVRYVLDNFKSATEAAEYIRDFVRVIPAKVDGMQLDCHFAIADKDATVYVAFEGTEVYIDQKQAGEQFVMTNFRLKGTSLEEGYYSVDFSNIEDYGQGVERANRAIGYAERGEDMMKVLTQRVKFTMAYTAAYSLTEFAGINHNNVRATIHDTEALSIIQASAAAIYQSEVSDGTLRDNADLWQTVHSVVYDLNAKTMRFLTQEIDGDAEPIVVDAFANEVAKQGSNPDATNTAIAALAASIGEKVYTLTALDSDIKAGKEALAREITGKGQPTSKDDTLMQMASAVQRIQHENVELDASGMYSKQLFGGDPDNSPLWNLYDVLAQMKNKYLGLYPGLIVCEYYKGYNSLQLQGADAYFTCDGDEYDYDALHTWHDGDNGRANRWVCFLFRSEAAEFNIVNTDISPRSMYVGGHIGTIRYFVNGRLTDFVCGIEETDVVDTFDPQTYTNPLQRICVMNGIDHFGNVSPIASSTPETVVCYGLKSISINRNDSHENFAAGAYAVYLPDLVNFTTSNSTHGSFMRYNLKLEVLKMPKFLGNVNTNFAQMILYGKSRLIDVEVGELNVSFATGTAYVGYWNPTQVIANQDNLAQLNANIRDHIAAKVSDRTGLTALTFTVSTNLYNNLEQATLDAFTAKNWEVRGA